MRWLLDNVLLNPLVLLPIGLIFAFVGAAQVYDFPATRSHISHVEQLPLLAGATPGQAAFVEGRISSQNPTVYRQFVTCLREEYHRRHWVEVARATPPLVIETGGGRARVTNNDYSLETTAVTVEEAAPTFTKGAVQARGFVAGSPALAVGSVAAGTEELVAEFLYAGTRAEYIAWQRNAQQRGLWWGSGFLLFGIGCVSLGVRQLRKFLRETRVTEQARATQAMQREQQKKAKPRWSKKKRR